MIWLIPPNTLFQEEICKGQSIRLYPFMEMFHLQIMLLFEKPVGETVYKTMLWRINYKLLSLYYNSREN